MRSLEDRIDYLTLNTQSTTLLSIERRAEVSWRNTLNLRPRMSRVLVNSPISFHVYLPCLTRKSRPNLMPSGRQSERLKFLPAFLPFHPSVLRTPFLPPCRSVLRKSVSFLKSAILPAQSGLRLSLDALSLHGYCNEKPARQGKRQGGMALR